MQKYADWLQTRLYQEHLDRLKIIRSKKFKKFPKQLTKEHNNQSSPIKNKIHSYRSNRQNSQAAQFIPLPLVSQRQRKMLGDAIKGNDMSLQQKQLLLENYLLGKRILKTESVLKSKQIKKEYKIHLKISKNMSRSLQSNRLMTEMRGSKFREFEKQEVIQTRKPSKGYGNYQLQLEINQILLIKGKLESTQVLYNIIFENKQGKQIGYKAVDLNQMLNDKLRFNFRKKDLSQGENLQFRLEMLRKNIQILIGSFQVPLSKQFAPENQKNPQQKQKEKRIENLFRQQPETATNASSKKMATIGSIQFSFNMRRRHFRMKTERHRQNLHEQNERLYTIQNDQSESNYSEKDKINQ